VQGERFDGADVLLGEILDDNRSRWQFVAEKQGGMRLTKLIILAEFHQQLAPKRAPDLQVA
jgi:hypothetical protein